MGTQCLRRAADERQQQEGQPQGGVVIALAQRRNRRSGSYFLVFDLDDEAQAKAWEVAQLLASQRKLKHVLVGMLPAVHAVLEQTGKMLDLLQFMATTATVARYEITEATAPEELPSMFAGAEDHADPAKAWQNFSARMGDLFSDDDDEWN